MVVAQRLGFETPSSGWSSSTKALALMQATANTRTSGVTAILDSSTLTSETKLRTACKEARDVMNYAIETARPAMTASALKEVARWSSDSVRDDAMSELVPAPDITCTLQGPDCFRLQRTWWALEHSVAEVHRRISRFALVHGNGCGFQTSLYRGATCVNWAMQGMSSSLLSSHSVYESPSARIEKY